MQTSYQVIVIGGGSSGMMAAISAAQQGASVLLLDKNPKLGRKLLLSGGGRCNVTNRTDRDTLIQHIPGNGKFLYSALNQFNQNDIIDFFTQRGISLKEEDHGRMFPTTDSARTILETLVQELHQLKVEVMPNQAVQAILYDKQTACVKGVKTQSGITFTAKSIIVAVGGRAYPKTGSTGDGYAWAKAAGHKIERLYPTEAPLISHDDFIVRGILQGLSLREVKVTLWQDATYQQAVVHHLMDMIFTHFGYSGPAILRCSGHVNQLLYQQQQAIAHLTIDLQPHLTVTQLQEIAEDYRDKQLVTILKLWMPERLAEFICQKIGVPASQPFKQIDHRQLVNLWHLLKYFPLTSTGSQPIEKGFVTGGGVSTKEIEPKTMASKLMQGLFFCGEIIDINGYTGGYNITVAFVTGHIAGQYAAWTSFT